MNEKRAEGEAAFNPFLMPKSTNLQFVAQLSLVCIDILARGLNFPCQIITGYSTINIKALIQTTRQNEMPIKKYFTAIFSRRKHASNDPDCAFYYERENVVPFALRNRISVFPVVITRAHTSYDEIGAQSTLSEGHNSSGLQHYIYRNSIKKRSLHSGAAM
ncbi:hypothetical protein [Brenneria izadpanahii]|uniref:hypothetical protein n=1 Tax=Brenneria izadpanahii TaxID=2722756 RepID=UPI001FEA4735|nr:hypothetical protein [Brenneria izadpanahii]